MKCVICGQETTKECLNESFDMLEPVCYDFFCEKEFWNSTAVVIPSECQEAQS